ncbi:OTU-like cysteine protease family protein [Aphelenchoides avenae]|nr:OTU-like cysteine protease family protein [Aphelenchus avenae]
MSDDQLSPMESLLSKHSKEKKELQAKITALKHSIPKNDKKKKKEVTTQVDEWEKELKLRHEAAVRALENELSALNVAEPNGDVKPVESKSAAPNDEPEEKGWKPTKAQKRREKKAEDLRRRAEAAAVDAKNAEFSQGHIEGQEIRRVLKERQLQLHEIAPDGDCMYNSLAHQLRSGSGDPMTGAELRRIAASYIRDNKDDFLPFLTNESGEPIDEFEFEDYCGKTNRSSAEGGAWGGAAELKAISSALGRRIEVLQPDGRIEVFGDHFGKKPLIITYHRFAYTLGEHYNSVTTASEPAS